MNCVICDKSLDGEDDVITLREKGSEGINRASIERNDTITMVPGQQVHQNCRWEYCLPSNIKQAKKVVSSETTSGRRSLTRKAERGFFFSPEWLFLLWHQSWILDKFEEKIKDGGLWQLTQKTRYWKFVRKGMTSGREQWELGLWMCTIESACSCCGLPPNVQCELLHKEAITSSLWGRRAACRKKEESWSSPKWRKKPAFHKINVDFWREWRRADNSKWSSGKNERIFEQYRERSLLTAAHQNQTFEILWR